MNHMRRIPICVLLSLLLCSCIGALAFSQEAQLSLYYEGNAQVELLSSDGTRILIDVTSPERLSEPPVSTALLLTTHDHPDHYNSTFRFPGRRLQMQAGELTWGGAKIRSIASMHSSDPPKDLRTGSNYIFIIEIAGFRLVHFGDTEQEELTDEQVEAIGQVDIGIMEFWLDPSDKFFKIAEQIRPRLIIPTHLGDGAAKQATERWKGYWLKTNKISLYASKLPPSMSIVFLGSNRSFGKYLNLEEWQDQ